MIFSFSFKRPNGEIVTVDARTMTEAIVILKKYGIIVNESDWVLK